MGKKKSIVTLLTLKKRREKSNGVVFFLYLVIHVVVKREDPNSGSLRFNVTMPYKVSLTYYVHQIFSGYLRTYPKTFVGVLIITKNNTDMYMTMRQREGERLSRYNIVLNPPVLDLGGSSCHVTFGTPILFVILQRHIRWRNKKKPIIYSFCLLSMCLSVLCWLAGYLFGNQLSYFYLIALIFLCLLCVIELQLCTIFDSSRMTLVEGRTKWIQLYANV